MHRTILLAITIATSPACSGVEPGPVGSGEKATSQDGGDGSTGTSQNPTSGSESDTIAEPGDDGTTESLPDDDGAPSPISFDLGSLPDAPTGQPCTEDVDVVFVMDVSTTMGGFLSTLADEIAAVDAALQSYDLPSQPHYGLVVFVDDFALLNAGAPYVDAMALQDDFTFWSGFTATNQQVGGGNSNASFEENSLDALYAAATGFQWRDAASTSRVVIHTTDDTFWDGPTTGNGVPIAHGYAETVDALQDAQVRVFSFADDIGAACNCEDVTPGWSSPYMAQPPIPEATDGQVFDIQAILDGTASLSDAIAQSVEASICDPYDPVG